MKVVVIGGVAGGPSFATRFRRLNEAHEIIIYERGENISYASCALPYYLGGVITDRDSLIERTPEILKTKNNIDVFTKHEVTAIDPSTKRLTVKDLSTFEAENGFVLRSVTDADRIKSFLEEKNPQLVYDKLLKEGLAVHLETRVTEIRDKGREIVLSDGSVLSADMLIFAVGVSPNNEVVKAAGIQLSDTGQIIVDDQLQTNLPDIYASGDIIETTSVVTGQPIQSMLSSAANRQGHMLADILNGTPMRYRGYIGAGVAKIFDHTASYTGMTEHALKASGITNYKTVFITPFDHAYFYPEATRLNLKLIFDADSGRILGGQAFGEKGVDKRMGELSVAITGNLTVFDLPDLELPYSPPYSTTRDPLNIAGYVAINQMTNIVETIKASDIPENDLKEAFFLDIREPNKAPSGSISATKNIPMNELRDRINEIPKDKKVYITFRRGLNTYTSARILAGLGIKAILIEE
ncbi:FAD-dependent oxidoreductase [Enterococcus faecium]|uniref:FAD-dependent oxidoreductase n=1 Tax=Enterococcus faecium TaxID=1352 RepID=UPI003219CDFD